MPPIDEPPIAPELIRDRLAIRAARARRRGTGADHDPDRLRIVAVTKARPVEVAERPSAPA